MNLAQAGVSSKSKFKLHQALLRLHIAFLLKPFVAGIVLSGHLVGALSRGDTFSVIWDGAFKSLVALAKPNKKTKAHTVGTPCEHIVLCRLVLSLPSE